MWFADALKNRTTFIVGSSKNAGKTTFLNVAACELRSRGPVALVSIGVDGEARDLVFGNAKPLVRVCCGDLIATTEGALKASAANPRLFAGEDRAFQAVFVYATHVPVADPRWSLNWTQISNGAGVRDLSLEMQEQSDGIQAYFQYRTELFTIETIDRFADDYVALLQAVAADPGRTLSSLV